MESKFLEKVSLTIEKYRLLKVGDGPVIVALSGGPDSVALLDALIGLGYETVAAHCNFHLRGDESDRDMEFVKDLCLREGVVCEIISFDVAARQKLTGESVEMACRELRYEWFGELTGKYHAQALATGHHRDDNIETLVLNLLRSTGLRGASAMRPRADRRVSPLIECSRIEILDYLDSRGLSFVTDRTNLENDYRRNKVRNIILPTVEAQFPDARERLCASIANLADDMSLLDEAIKEWSARFISADSTIDLDEVRRSSRTPQSLMYRLLEPYGFNRSQTDDIINGERSGAKYRSREFEAVVSRGVVRLSRIGTSWNSAPELVMETMDVSGFAPSRDAMVATFDVAILDGNPTWEVRTWREGDRMKPFGMKGRSKKLSDIFNDTKVDDQTKHSPIVVTRNGEIVWVAGIRQSDLYRITSTTQMIVKLSLV